MVVGDVTVAIGGTCAISQAYVSVCAPGKGKKKEKKKEGNIMLQESTKGINGESNKRNRYTNFC